MPDPAPTIRNYFVDEAGDSVLFNAKGKVIVETPGCSRYFMLGLLDVVNPDELTQDFEGLRIRLLNDTYLSGIPSLQPQSRKTALAFHAKDDPPEVRQEVFKTLTSHDVKFFAVVRDKQAVVAYVKERNDRDARYRYSQNELYEYLGRRLFRDRLHKDSGYKVCFARRGSADRTRALGEAALSGGRDNFERKWGIRGRAPIEVVAKSLPESASLQAVDYFLWALQRVYERGEDRYLRYVWSKISLVQDIDDTRVAKYGVYYTQENPLAASALKKE